jgi:surface antigen
MNQQFDERTLSAFIDGELDPETMRAVDAFLAKNETARNFVLDAVRATAFLRGSAQAVLYENVPDHLIAAVQAGTKQKPARKLTRRPLLRMAAAIALVMLGVGVGSLFERKGGSPYPMLSASLPESYAHVVEQALEFNRSGIAEEWRAPSDPLTVRVTPVKTYRDKNGLYFREYRLETSLGGERSKINGLAYRTADGRWKTKAVFYQ